MAEAPIEEFPLRRFNFDDLEIEAPLANEE